MLQVYINVIVLMHYSQGLVLTGLKPCVIVEMVAFSEKRCLFGTEGVSNVSAL